MLKQLDKFHKTKTGHLLFGLVELAIAYGFVSLAIDRGSFFYYFLTLVFLVGALQNFLKLVGKVLHGNKATKTRRP
ncbi:MAG: hypothetical protein JWO35_645 [Candidatus Saccharibacteria bacterium]|nr:hypothetical protein [Candidatus Saccharibacteria bacterium]